jgi:hypothetical protein
MGPALLQGAGVEQLASSALERVNSNILELSSAQRAPSLAGCSGVA